MSDNRDTEPSPEPEIPAAERAEARAIRRRWITLGELVAVAAVVISGLTFWSNYSDRKAAEAERSEDKAEKEKAASRVTLTGTPEGGGSALRIAAAAQTVQRISVRFPSVLRIGAQQSTVEPSIEASWFDDVLLKLTDGGPDAQQGALPALITAEWWDGERQLSDTSLYDIAWETRGRTLQGRELTLRGIALRRRLSGDGTAELDAAWSRAKPPSSN